MHSDNLIASELNKIDVNITNGELIDSASSGIRQDLSENKLFWIHS